jgi:hypothetical protein
MKGAAFGVYTPNVLRLLLSIVACLCACAAPDHGAYLKNELGFLQLGVRLASEEKEVRRVLAQRGLRVVARLEDPHFIALGAATRDGLKSAVRVISPRGVVVASDAALDDLFAPAQVALIEHFGGTIGEYLLVAEARVARGHDAGCVTLHRVLADGNVVAAVLDVSALGSRACVSNLAPARSGHIAATVAWPGLHALTTPQLDVELAFTLRLLEEQAPLVPVARIVENGDWLDRERTRLSTLRLAHAEFSERHAAGVGRAAVALMAGQDTATQVSAYRNAVARVFPNSTESQIMDETTEHIERGWLDPFGRAPEGEAGTDPAAGEGEVVEPEAPRLDERDERNDGQDTVIEPSAPEIR